MNIVFKKMHLLGNDFMVINGIQQTVSLNSSLIRQWADRKRGIGFDQLLLLEKSLLASAHFHYRIFNADGSEIFQCGNGALCIEKFLSSEGFITEHPIRLTTHTGVLELQLRDHGETVVNLGIPIFTPEKIPFITSSPGPMHTLETPMGRFDCCILSLGNPHCVLQVHSLEQAPVSQLGIYLNTRHPLFPKGTNVEFASLLSPLQIRVRVYERGVGETQACGSGACAAVVAGRMLKKLDEKVSVCLPGGTLQVEWQDAVSPVYLIGEGHVVFSGTITDELID